MSTEASPLLPKHSTPSPTTPSQAEATPSSSTTEQLTDTTDERAQPPLAPEEEPDLRTPAEKRASLRRWLAFWAILAGAVVFCVVEAIKEGGGEIDWKGALKKAGGGVSVEAELGCMRSDRAVRGSTADQAWWVGSQGLAGALAMVLQVLTLMPLRTVMNFQYRYGGTMVSSIKTLWADRGFARFYDGLGPALFQGPISRFGDTAANAGILALLASNPFLNRLPSPMKTAFASVAGALFRCAPPLLPSAVFAGRAKLNPPPGAAQDDPRPGRHAQDDDANARLGRRPAPQGPRAQVRRRDALVRRVGDRGCVVRRVVPLVRDLQLAFGRPPLAAQPAREAPEAGLHRVRGECRERHDQQLAPGCQDVQAGARREGVVQYVRVAGGCRRARLER